MTAVNVAVMAVNQLSTGFVDASGSDVPSWEVVGSGALTFLTAGGRVVTGTWQRDDLDQQTRYLDDAGNSVTFTPGVTWLQLLPASGGSVTVE